MQLVQRRRLAGIVQPDDHDLVLTRREQHEPEPRQQRPHLLFRGPSISPPLQSIEQNKSSIKLRPQNRISIHQEGKKKKRDLGNPRL